MASPERSFGSNHVVLGGIIMPLSAMSVSCFMETGYSAKATFISPLSTLEDRASRPLIPPTKSMRLSVRRSLIPRSLSRTRVESTVTSSTPIGSESS